MATVADLQIKYSADTGNAEAGTKKVEGLVSGLGGKIGTVLGTAGGFLLAQGIQSVVGGVGQLAAAGLDFEAGMANVNSIAQLSTGELDALSESVFQLSGDPRITQGPAALAAGLYDIYSSGFQGADGLMVLEAAALAATAGVTTTDVASRAITASLNAYGLGAEQAGHVSDVLFKVVDKGVITFEQLANNLGNTLPIANSLGVGIEELGAAYALMTLKGVNASQAETQIAALMRSSLNPTQELTDAVGKHGYASAEAAIASEGMAGFLSMVMEASGGSKEALFDMLGTQEAVNAALILGAEDGQDYVAMLEEMEGAAGATDRALQKQMQSARFNIAIARKEVERLAVLFMGMLAPAISFAASTLAGFISGVIAFISNMKLALSDGVLWEQWLSAQPGFIQPVLTLFRELITAAGDVVDAFQDLMAGDVSGFFDELQEAANTAFDALLQFASVTLDWILDTGIPTVIGWVADNAGAVWEGIKSLVGWAWNNIADLGTIIIQGVPALGGGLLNIAGRAWAWVKEQLGFGPIVGDGTGINPIAQEGINLGDVLIDGVAKLGAALQAVANDLWGWVKDQLGVSTGPIKRGASPITLGDVLIDGAAKLGATLEAVADDLWGWVKEQLGVTTGPVKRGAEPIDIGTVIFEGKADFEQFVREALTSFATAIRGVDWVGKFKEALGGSSKIGEQLGQWMREGISNLSPGDVVEAGKMVAIAAAIVAALAAAFILLPFVLVGALLALLGSAILGFVEGITGLDLSDVAGAIVGRIKTAIEDFVGFAESVKNALVEKVKEAAGLLSDLSTMDFSALAGALAAAIPAAIAAFANFAAGIKTQIIQEFRESIPSAGDLYDIGEAIASALWTAIKDKAVDFFKLDELMDILRGSGGEGSTIPGTSTDEHGEVPRKTKTGLDKSSILGDGKVLAPDYTLLINAANTARQAVEAAFTNMQINVARIVGNAVTSATAAFQPIIQNLTNTTNTTRQNVEAAFINMQIKVASTLEAFVTDASAKGLAAGAQFSTNLNQGLGAAAANVLIKVAEMKTQLTNFASDASAKGLDAGAKFSTNLNQGMAAALANVQIKMGQIKAALDIGSQYNTGYSIGSTLGSGINAGIADWTSTIAATAAAAVYSAASAARFAAQSSSPSKLFMRIGKDLMLGAAIGVDRQAPAFADSMRDSMLAGISAFKGSANAPTLGRYNGGMAYAGRYGSSENVTINNNYILKSDELVRIIKGSENGTIAVKQMGTRQQSISLGLARA